MNKKIKLILAALGATVAALTFAVVSEAGSPGHVGAVATGREHRPDEGRSWLRGRRRRRCWCTNEDAAGRQSRGESRLGHLFRRHRHRTSDLH